MTLFEYMYIYIWNSLHIYWKHTNEIDKLHTIDNPSNNIVSCIIIQVLSYFYTKPMQIR